MDNFVLEGKMFRLGCEVVLVIFLELSFNLNGFLNWELKVIEKKNFWKFKIKKINLVKVFYRDDGEDLFLLMVKIDYLVNKKDYVSCYKDFVVYIYM